jgi:uncharacterized protein YlxW (UPF0749 family)
LKNELSQQSQDLKDAHCYIQSVEQSKRTLKAQLEESQEFLAEVKRECAATLQQMQSNYLAKTNHAQSETEVQK